MARRSFASLTTLASILILAAGAFAQSRNVNYDESKVPDYTLPDPLIDSSGDAVTDARSWKSHRRGEILELFQTHVYGRSPDRPDDLKFKVLEEEEGALDGKAIRKQVAVLFDGSEAGPKMELLIYLPAEAKRPTPVFLALNFAGNHSIHPDPAIRLSQSWMRPGKPGVDDNRATEAARGASSSRWPVEKILARGYGLVTAYYGDIDPDYDDGFQNGVHPLFYEEGQKKPEPDEWGSIAAWAWGLSRAMDYLQTDKQIDEDRVAVMGHSRLGKTALWAGARDERFALVISNNSGCGGAALSRRRYGEKVSRINTSFPHWFCDNFTKYNDNESELPVDQHELIALVAPRPVYVASAVEDRWADPRGEFLSLKGGEPVYRLLGAGGLDAEKMPPVDQPVMGTMAYHIRSGRHGVTDFDWQRYMDFADLHYGSGE